MRTNSMSYRPAYRTLPIPAWLEQERHEPLRAAHVAPVRIANRSQERALLDADAIAVDDRDGAHQHNQADPVGEGESYPEEEDRARRVRRMAHVVVGAAVHDHLIRPNDHGACEA